LVAQRPEHRPSAWHPVKSDPALAAGLGWIAHIGAVVLALVCTVVLGMLIGLLGTALDGLGGGWQQVGGVLATAGVIVMFSVLFSWLGHLPGAFFTGPSDPVGNRRLVRCPCSRPLRWGGSGAGRRDRTGRAFWPTPCSDSLGLPAPAVAMARTLQCLGLPAGAAPFWVLLAQASGALFWQL